MNQVGRMVDIMVNYDESTIFEGLIVKDDHNGTVVLLENGATINVARVYDNVRYQHRLQNRPKDRLPLMWKYLKENYYEHERERNSRSNP